MKSLLTYGLLLVAAALVRPASVEACARAASQLTVMDTPVNGAVVVYVTCVDPGCFDGDVPDELPLRDTLTDELFTGTVIHVSEHIEDGGLILVRPASELTEDRSYELVWRPDLGDWADGDNPQEFLVLPAASWTLDQIAVSARAELRTRPTETVSCEPGYYGNCEDSAVATAVAEYVALSIDIDRPVHNFMEHELLLSMATWSMGAAEPPLSEVITLPQDYFDASGSFDTHASSYCYRVRLTSTLDGSTIEHDGCIEDTFGELMTSTVTADERSVHIERCRTPPEGYEEEFCEVKRSYCARSPGIFECDLVETICEGVETDAPPLTPEQMGGSFDPEDEPTQPSEGEPIVDAGLGGFSNAGGNSGGDQQDEADDDKPAMKRASSGGCSVAPDQRGSAGGLAALMLLLLAAFARCARAARSA